MLFSWPPAADSTAVAAATGGGETTFDYYDAGQFGKLASNIRIDSPVQSATASPASSSSSTTSPHEGGSSATSHSNPHSHPHTNTGPAGQSDPDSPYAEVKTSCTRRYRSQQSLIQPAPSGGGLLTMHDVESIFIPHGSVIFACHQVLSSRPYTPEPPSSSSLSSAFDSYSTTGFASGSSVLFSPTTPKAQSQAWTLKPNPRTSLPSLSSLASSFPNENANVNNTSSLSPFSTTTSFSSSSTTNSSAVSPAFPVTPASGSIDARDREWPSVPSSSSASVSVAGAGLNESFGNTRNGYFVARGA